MKTYTVKVKDYNQDTTHTLTQRAESQNEANKIIYDYLVKMLGHSNLEII
jgi:hypothetical protein